MATFHIDDLVRILSVRHLADYTGRIIAFEEQSPTYAQNYYHVEMNQTGLIRIFPESHLELVDKSS